mmetsp:Transcript_43529/g.79681  ORF Transcript_43529/g.79681 Transcript_43529/m.79681 type:complete len:454 (-) Transcript_43529:219-1580(-)
MGRVTDKHSYQVKNTFVELVPSNEDAQFLRGQRAMSDCCGGAAEARAMVQIHHEQTPESAAMPRTPSPFLHPCAPPGGIYVPPYGGPDDGLPIAFGDDMGGYGMPSYDYSNMPGTFVPGGMPYDPCQGTYMGGYDWCMSYDNSGYGMMDVQTDMATAEGQGTTEALMAALSDKISQDKQGDEAVAHADAAAMEELCIVEPPTEAQQECDLQATAAALAAALSANGHNAKPEGSSEQTGSRRRRGGRDRGGGQSAAAAANAAGSQAGTGNSGTLAADASRAAGTSSGAIDPAQGMEEVPQNFTTVMFRNIPNKYTREMLVNQLEQEMRGLFDFVYLPIDFKNKCNVGYAFINFRSIEACMTFVNRFNGVEVRKCLPGLISRKVTEVTPARVQGFEENVQRLRNSPVMRELASKPEWMPLIFDGNGEQMPFPAPERPLDPIKPRRRARDDEAYFR